MIYVEETTHTRKDYATTQKGDTYIYWYCI